MHKRFVLFIFSATTILAVSCAPSVSRSGDYGKISVAVGGPSARGVETGWPGGTLPTFSSITVTVSGSDMSTVTTTSSGSSAGLTVQVPSGTNRRVEVMAVPTPGGGAPYFAMGYSGSAAVDVSEGETVNVAIKLTLAKTRILLQDRTSSAIYSADSISGTINADFIQGVYFNGTSDPTFDQYGRLYYFDAEMSYLYRYNADLAAPEQLYVSGISDVGLFYSPSNNRLYYFYNPGSWELQYFDVAKTGEPSPVWVNKPSDVMYYRSAVAVDDAGYVFACSYEEASGQERIVKLSVGPESSGSADATTVASKAYSAIGLTFQKSGVTTPLTVQDLYVKDGVLYVAASDVAEIDNQYASISACYSRGKVIALSTDTLAPIWTTGWSGDANQLPTDPTSQFYGPVRVVGIAPKKLYIADDGYSLTGSAPSTTQVNKNRVVELDTETGAFSAIGLEDEVQFFTSYSYTFVC